MFKRLLYLSVAAVAAFSCGDAANTLTQVKSSGKPYEVFVIATQPVWNSAAGDTLRVILGEEAEMLNQPEPLYDIFNISPGKVNSTILRHRNLIRMDIDAKYHSPDMLVAYDVSAGNQIEISVVAPRADSMAAFLDRNREILVGLLDKTERDRMALRARKFNSPQIEKDIDAKFGFGMSIPRGYRVRNAADNFLWLSNEFPLASQGVVIYTFPFTSLEDYTDPKWLVYQRNVAVNKIPGPLEDTWMSTEEEFYPVLRSFKINDRQWNEMRGFWRVENDFMGGPFVNYTTVDAPNRRVIAIDMYVYSPSARFGKRNYIRQLENLIVNVNIPDSTSD